MIFIWLAGYPTFGSCAHCMPGAQRLQVAELLYWSARRMKLAGLRSQHPDWTEQRLKDEVHRIFSHART